MARAGAAVALAFAVCCLLVAPAPARRPVDLPPGALHAAADAAEQGTALAVPEEDPAGEEKEEPRQRPFLFCLVFRCGGEPAGMGSSEEPADRWVRPAVAGKAEAEEAGDVVGRPYETDSDSDCDSDSDDEDEDGGVLGWLWRLADRF